jgi:hypothetical protein
MAAHYRTSLGPNESTTLRLRLTDAELIASGEVFFADFDRIFAQRQRSR